MNFRRFGFVLAASAALVACGDDDPSTPGDTSGVEATQPVLSQIQNATVVAGETIQVVASIDNPDALSLSWTATSSTLSIPEGAIVGNDAGAELTLDSTTDNVGAHVVRIAASWDGGEVAQDVSVTIAAPEPCRYPVGAGFDVGLPFPDYSWVAEWADGERITFDLYDFYCNDDAWGDYETLVVMATADWCPNCPAYMRWIDGLGEKLEEEGMLVLFLDLQTYSYGPATTTNANAHVSLHTPNGVGLRAGDANNLYEANAVATSRLIEFFPSSFVIRRSDMQMIADQRDIRGSYLPLVSIAREPEADWSAPHPPVVYPDFESECEDGDEEASEPNNSVDEAAVIDGPTSFDGGICDVFADIFSVEIDGDWTLTMESDADVGDLDVYVWDVASDRPERAEDGSAVGSQTDEDVEQFSYSGPATVVVLGFSGATGPYSLSITTP